MALYTRAYLLLKEECPRSVQFIHKHDDEVYPWIFDGHVYGLQGVGRFMIGLLDEVMVLEGEGLKDYVKGKLNESGFEAVLSGN